MKILIVIQLCIGLFGSSVFSSEHHGIQVSKIFLTDGNGVGEFKHFRLSLIGEDGKVHSIANIKISHSMPIIDTLIIWDKKEAPGIIKAYKGSLYFVFYDGVDVKDFTKNINDYRFTKIGYDKVKDQLKAEVLEPIANAEIVREVLIESNAELLEESEMQRLGKGASEK